MAWTLPQFKPQEINAAGKIVAAAYDDPDFFLDYESSQKYDRSIDIINNWRSSHAYPLNTFQVNLRKAAKNTIRMH